MSQGGVMSFTEHLAELRTRLVRVALVLTLGFFACWSFRVEIFGFLSGPISRALADNGIYQFHAIQITESILVYLKTSFVAAVLLTSPITFYQAWAFVNPGLLKKERGFLLPVTFFTVVFFLIGAAFSYQVILPFITDWLVKLTLEGGQAAVMVTLQNAYSTSFIFLLMFGLVFQLPLVIFFLSLFGVVTWKGLARFFRYFVVLSFVASALLTPPDPVSQVLMALPLNVLYAFGILVAWGVERSRREDGTAASAGLTLTRLMGASLLLLGLATGLTVAFVRTLPQKDMTRMVPEDTAWMIVANPSAIMTAPHMDRAVFRVGRGSTWLTSLGEVGVHPEGIHESALVGVGDGSVALLLRQPGLGSWRDAVRATFQEASIEAMVATLDEDTLAIGSDALVGAISSVAHDETRGIVISEEEERLLSALRTSGPVWAWIPHPEDRGGEQLGADIAGHAGAAGAALAPGIRNRVVLRIHGRDGPAADAVEAHLDLARSRVGSRHARQAVLVRAVGALAAELKRGVRGPRRHRLDAVEASLAALSEAAGGSQVPILDAMGADVAGWALQRDAVRVTLSAELSPEGLTDLAESLAGRIP